MYTVREIDTEPGLDALRGDWDDLLRRSPRSSVFQTWEWLSSCWRHFGAGKRMRVISVWERDRLMGLAPLEAAAHLGLPIRRVQSIGTGISDYLDFILDAHAEAPVLAAICDWLADRSCEWDIIDLQNVPDGSPLLDPPARGWSQVRLEQDINRYVGLPSNPDEVTAGLERKHRKELLRKARSIVEELGGRMLIVENADLEEGMQALFRLHAMRWQARGERGVMGGPSLQSFYLDAARLLAERGWLRLAALKLNGEIQSAALCFAYNGKGSCYITGWNPALARYSLGSATVNFYLRDAVEQGLQEFDFLRGDEPYKQRWADRQRSSFRLVISGGTMRSRAAAAILGVDRRIGHRTRTLAKRLLGLPIAGIDLLR